MSAPRSDFVTAVEGGAAAARPLAGRRVLVTRPGAQAGPLVGRLEELGAAVLALPAVEIRPPADWSAVDRALDRLDRYAWVVFTSANGVRALVGRMRDTGRDLDTLAGRRLAAVGPATAEALGAYGLRCDLVPAEYCSEGLAAALRGRVAGQRLLLARADRGREVLREELAGVADVESVAVYRQTDAALGGSPALRALDAGEVDYVTLTSSNIARALAAALGAEGRARIERGSVGLVTISPLTSAAVRALGLPVAAEAAVQTTDGLVEALVRLAVKDRASV